MAKASHDARRNARAARRLTFGDSDTGGVGAVVCSFASQRAAPFENVIEPAVPDVEVALVSRALTDDLDVIRRDCGWA
jgi:hypothetical protein